MQRKGQTQANSKALFSAIESNNIEIIKLLASPETQAAKNQNGKTPIMRAAELDNWEVVDFLLAEMETYKNFDNSTQNQLGSVLLDYCTYQYMDIKTRNSSVQRLLKFGAPHTWHRQHNYPLHFAAKNGYKDIVYQLIEAGADLGIENANKKSPLQLAIDGNHIECIKLLSSFDKYKIEYNLKKNSDLIAFAVLILSDDQCILNQLPNDIMKKICSYFKSNFLLETINLLAQGRSAISYKLTLISAQCALEAYEKIAGVHVPVDAWVPSFVRSDESIHFFSETKKILADKNLPLKDKSRTINEMALKYNTSNTNGRDLLRRFHLLSPSSSTPVITHIEDEEFVVVNNRLG